MTSHRRKVCRDCHAEKWIGNFYRHPTYADGYMSACKVCKRAYQVANDALKCEAIKVRKAAWAKRPENREKRRQYAQTPAGKAVKRTANRIWYVFRRVQMGKEVRS